MATLNGKYIHVTDEQLSTASQATENPVERGVDISDHVEQKPDKITLTGKFQDNFTEQILRNWQKSIRFVQFNGRHSFYGLIMDIQTGKSYKNALGADYTMTILEVRKAGSSKSATPTTTRLKTVSYVGRCQVQEVKKIGCGQSIPTSSGRVNPATTIFRNF